MITAQEIATHISGELAGEGSLKISGVSSIDTAKVGELSFIDNPKYLSCLKTTEASVVIIGQNCPYPEEKTVIISENPTLSFSKAIELFMKPENVFASGISTMAQIHPGATLGKNVSVGPFSIIEEGVIIGEDTAIGAGCYLGVDTRIGTGSKLYPNVSVFARSTIGSGVIIHSGAVIGSDGFGYVKVNGKNTKLGQLGTVVIDDDVEIGANVSIDRARFGRTYIGKRVKIDNLVQIAHNVQIGDDCILVAQAGIAGSAHLKKNATIAGQVGVGGHLTIGEGAIIMAQSGVSKDVPAGEFWFGYPARNVRETNKDLATVKRIPRLLERIKTLEKEIEQLKNKA